MDETLVGEIKVDAGTLELLGRKLYENPHMVILVRELLQNARDACRENKGKVAITVETHYDGTGEYNRVTCDDTGCGMSAETLMNVFLYIGRSGKAHDEGSVGGFGIAKVALFATHDWAVHTRNISIQKNDLTLARTDKPRKGTVVSAIVKHDWADRRAREMVYTCDVPRLTYNGARVPAYRGKTVLLDSDGYGGFRVSLAKPLVVNGNETSNIIVWRIRGLTQFTQRLGFYGEDYGCNVIVDFDNITYRPSSSEYPFTLNREGVASGLLDIVNALVKPIVKNKLSGMENATRKRENVVHVQRKNGLPVITVGTPRRPGNFAKNVKVANAFAAVLQAMHGAQARPEFGFGIIYSPTTRAQMRDDNGHTYFMLNVEDFVDTWSVEREKHAANGGGGDPALALALFLYHEATHEMTHYGYEDHDEGFSSGEGDTVRTTMFAVAAAVPRIRSTLNTAVRTLDALAAAL